ncbi:hypothetical protein LOCC1_G004799 [Lachnellula occidentalis]|uniref:Nephrocystin 3-like N-terminal domain-containing protein n=1 Tax=Lachnellula occidentalis TaxID=215460 RepID=A0A8H8RTZ4_9HELO|nr:hypothetical protein LOCC1_G004799 [Lachnellula occidentalis]
MDGLSGAASVIAVLQLATAVGSVLKDYYEGVRDAREDIRKLYASIKGLEGILERLKDVAKGISDETLFTQPLEGVEAELKELMGKLQGSKASKTRARRALQSLAWPFEKKDAEKSVIAIEKHKSGLSLLIGVEILHLGSEQFDITADIRADIRLARFDKSRQRIVDWLSKGIPNPSQEHNVARERHEETTGSWLINDSNDYLGWLTSPNSFLWLNGGAGAGKSILCNRRDTPPSLQNEYERANFGQQKPTMKSCIAMLKEVMAGFDNVYIVLDALDECPKVEEKRHKLLDLLHDVCDWNLSSLHILVTSRRESGIVDSFTSFADELNNFTSIIAAGPQVEDDIKKYLQHQLQSSLFKNWTKPLTSDVEIALASKANGMFRLVALQLEALGKLRTVSAIRSAMKNLPKTLDAFYDRIILDVPEGDHEIANRALQWIAFAARPLSLKELAEAVIISPEHKPCLRDENRLMESEGLLDFIPSGLIRTVHVELRYDNTIQEIFDSSSEQDDTSKESYNGSYDGGDIESVDGSRSCDSFTTAGYGKRGTKVMMISKDQPNTLASCLLQDLKYPLQDYLKSIEILQENLLMRRSLLGSIRPLLSQGVSDVIADVRK